MKANILKKRARQFFFILMLLSANFIYAQTSRKPDVILLRDATKLEVVIQEVDDKVIKYKKVSDPEGPLFSVKKAEITSIQYGNGDTETFEAVLEVPNYYSPGASKPPVSAPSTTAVTPKATFQQELQTATPDRLRAFHKYYKDRSRVGKIMGFVGIPAGMLLAGIGTGIVAGAMDSNGNFNTYHDERRAITGAWMMVGGFAGAVTFGTVGFVKAGRNGSKATRVRRELIRRNEPITFRISPGFNPANGAGFLTLNAKF